MDEIGAARTRSPVGARPTALSSGYGTAAVLRRTPWPTGSLGSPTGWSTRAEKGGAGLRAGFGRACLAGGRCLADLADALNWRLKKDRAAAERAGLDQRGAAIACGEPHRRSTRAADTRPDRLHTREDLASDQLAERSGRSSPRISESSSSAARDLAVRLAVGLRRDVPATRRRRAHLRARGGGVGRHVAAWRRSGGVLVRRRQRRGRPQPAGGRRGRASAPAMVAEPLGAAHRPGGPVPGGSPGSPARAVRGRPAPTASSRCRAPGCRCLTRRSACSAESVSALQDTIDQGLADIWAAAALDGPEGLSSLTARVTDDLKRERREIDEMDMLDGIHDARTGVVDIAAAIGELERQLAARSRRRPVGTAGSGRGGLRLLGAARLGPAARSLSSSGGARPRSSRRGSWPRAARTSPRR